MAQNRLQDALETGLRALAALGEPLPRRPGKAQAAAALLRTKLTMRRWTDERLLQLPPCADRRTVEAQRILGELRNISYVARPELFPAIIDKKLQLTVTRGLVPSSPAAFASFGVLLVVTGDHLGSQRFGELGLLLADRVEFHEARPETQFLHLDFIRPWRHSIREGLPQLQRGLPGGARVRRPRVRRLDRGDAALSDVHGRPPAVRDRRPGAGPGYRGPLSPHRQHVVPGHPADGAQPHGPQR